MNTDEERDDKLKELEDKLENALERIDELEDQPPSEEGDEQQDSIQIESAGEAPFRVHWIDPSVETSVSCGDIDSVKKAQDAFAEANVYRNANAHRIMHGDVLILMCNYASVSDACYYVGLCVVTNTPNQVEAPASPDITSDSGTKEFMAWFTCPGEGGTSCIPDGSETLVPHVSDVSWNNPSLGADGVKTHVITFTKKELVFDSCGGYVRSDSASPEEITIKECCEEGDPPESPCGDGLPDTFTFTPTGGAPVTLTRDPNLGGTGMGCNQWWSDVALTWTGDYVLSRIGIDSWVVGGAIPNNTCAGINVTQFAKIGGPNASPTGSYECADNVGVVQGVIS